MTLLSTLKLSTQSKPSKISQVQVRRNKLAQRLWEQGELAKAKQAGTQFNPIKFRTVKDAETGLRKQVEQLKNIKQWWWTTDNGKIALSVRFGPRLVELAKGKFAVELASEKDLISTLDLLRQATLYGELDGAIENVALKLRDGFKK
jgi:hypothetical protein